VVPTIIGHARFTEEPHHIYERSSKLTLKQCLLNFILYIKHNNVTKYDAFLWIWSNSAINDDGIFITSCINSAISNEIRWPLLRSIGSWLHNFHNSKATLDLLMVLSSKFVSPGTIQPIKVGLMGERRCIA